MTIFDRGHETPVFFVSDRSGHTLDLPIGADLAQLDSTSTKLIHLDKMKAKNDDNKEPNSIKVLPM